MHIQLHLVCLNEGSYSKLHACCLLPTTLPFLITCTACLMESLTIMPAINSSHNQPRQTQSICLKIEIDLSHQLFTHTTCHHQVV